MEQRRRLLDILALGCVIATTAHLGSRFNTSAAFARPIHFSVLALLVTGLAFLALGRLACHARPSLLGTYPDSPPSSLNSSGYSTPTCPASPTLSLFGVVRVPRDRRAFLRFLKRYTSHGLRVIGRVARSSCGVLIASIVCRTLLLWRVVRDIQCSWSGVEAFLPFLVCVVDIALPPPRAWMLRGVWLGSGSNGSLKKPRIHTVLGHAQYGYGQAALIKFSILALVWAFAAAKTAVSWTSPTGVICPRSGWFERIIPTAQIIGVMLDAVVVSQLARIPIEGADGCDEGASASTLDNSSSNGWYFLSSIFLADAAILGLFACITFCREPDIVWMFRLRASEVLDLAIDVAAVAILFVSLAHLLSVFYPATLALVVSGLSLYASHLAGLSNASGLDWRWWASSTFSLFPVVMLACTGLLVKHDRDMAHFRPLSSAPYTLPHRVLMGCYLVLVGAAAYSHLTFSISAGSALRSTPSLNSVIMSARTNADVWEARASSSRTLEQAVQGYRARNNGLPPPPNFDKWFEYAMARNSVVIDEYQRISTDLLPFWGVKPSVIRNRTAFLLEAPGLSMGGLRIRQGEIELSPNIPGTHMWMIDGMAKMILPFVRWLPDMDLVFNLDDECRVAVPFEDRAPLLQEAREAQTRLARATQTRLLSTFGPPQGKPPGSFWPDKFDIKHWQQYQEPPEPHPEPNPERSAQPKPPSPPTLPPPPNLNGAPFFANYHATPIFQDLVAPACPPDSPARITRWWNRRESCSACAAAHTTLTPQGRVVSNWTAAADACHQPDLEALDGFLLAPAAMVATTTLFPVFSQAKVSGFADVLIPSPWNFNGKSAYDPAADVPWDEKRNEVFWRGSTSDGYAASRAWTSFARARFVDAADARAASCAVAAIAGDAPSTGTGRSDTAHHTRHSAPHTRYSAPRTRHSAPSCPVHANVSLVGEFQRCDREDCAAEYNTFFLNSRLRHKQQKEREQEQRKQHQQHTTEASATARSKLPAQQQQQQLVGPPSQAETEAGTKVRPENAAAVPFEEHWRYRHLVDLDGAGFSGRFLPFLQSTSLVYRAALFRTWFDERVHPWRHFVPLDLRLGDGLWAVVDFFGGSYGNDGGVGARLGEEIAREGKEWAERALRNEDMEIYLFRLLLEWGRLVDDRREEMGFVLASSPEVEGEPEAASYPDPPPASD